MMPWVLIAAGVLTAIAGAFVLLAGMMGGGSNPAEGERVQAQGCIIGVLGLAAVVGGILWLVL